MVMMPAVLIAFDLIELDGEDLRRSPIEYRKRKRKRVRTVTSGHRLERTLRKATVKSSSSTPASSAVRASSPSGSAHLTALAACRIGSIKNPHAPAVKRKAEDD
jgi:hypothetical protein